MSVDPLSLLTNHSNGTEPGNKPTEWPTAMMIATDRPRFVCYNVNICTNLQLSIISHRVSHSDQNGGGVQHVSKLRYRCYCFHGNNAQCVLASHTPNVRLPITNYASSQSYMQPQTAVVSHFEHSTDSMVNWSMPVWCNRTQHSDHIIHSTATHHITT